MALLSIVLGGLVGWLIAHAYYRLSSKEAARDLARLKIELRNRNTPEDFLLSVRRSRWRTEYIKNVQTWIDEGNASFQIEIGDNDRPFDEPWSRGFPDGNSTRYSVFLKINGVAFRELTFVSLDGGRINVPLPKQIVDGDDVTYVWDPSDISFAVGKIVGTYYRHADIEKVARRCRVEILREKVL